MLTPEYPAPMMTISLSWGKSAVVRSSSSGCSSVLQKGVVELSTGKHAGVPVNPILLKRNVFYGLAILNTCMVLMVYNNTVLH